MNIQLEDNGKKGRAYFEDKAEMTFSRAGSKLLIIDHTDVAEELKGQGVGRKLLNKVVSYARENQIKILPLCPFAKSVFDKDPSISDVLR